MVRVKTASPGIAGVYVKSSFPVGLLAGTMININNRTEQGSSNSTGLIISYLK
jgi:hypothetical protein